VCALCPQCLGGSRVKVSLPSYIVAAASTRALSNVQNESKPACVGSSDPGWLCRQPMLYFDVRGVHCPRAEEPLASIKAQQPCWPESTLARVRLLDRQLLQQPRPCYYPAAESTPVLRALLAGWASPAAPKSHSTSTPPWSQLTIRLRPSLPQKACQPTGNTQPQRGLDCSWDLLTKGGWVMQEGPSPPCSP
jgi:hypothetical protein